MLTLRFVSIPVNSGSETAPESLVIQLRLPPLFPRGRHFLRDLLIFVTA